MNVTFLAAILAIMGLAPAAAYVFGRRVDPFNPAIFVGGITFGACAYKPLRYTKACLAYVKPGELSFYLLVCVISLAAFYLGCLYARRRGAKQPPRGVGDFAAYNPSRLLVAGLIFAAVADASYVITYHHYRASGYIRDLSALRLPAAILCLQAALLDRRHLRAATVGVLMGIGPSVARFITYGGRAVTVEMFLLPLVAFLFWGRRPPKVALLAVALIGGLTVHYLAETRSIIGEGLASNRVSALILAFKGQPGAGAHAGTGTAALDGAAEMATVRRLQNYDKGGVLWNFAIEFLPHAWFPGKYSYATAWDLQPRIKMVARTTTFREAPGSAPTGYADVFIEIAWLAPVAWFFLGWWAWATYGRAAVKRDMAFQGYYIVLLFALLYLVAQMIFPFLQNWLFSIVPLALVYWQCRELAPASSPGRGRVPIRGPASAR